MAAQGPNLVVASSDAIGLYDERDHRWFNLEGIPGLVRLMVAVNRLWGLDDRGQLWSSAIGADTGTWSRDATDVVSLYGDSELVVWLSETDGVKQVFVKERHQEEPEARQVIATNALAGDSRLWRVSTVHNGSLYLAPHAGGIARYNFETHQWQSIGLPAGKSTGSILELVASKAGLWLLTSHDLFTRVVPPCLAY